MNTRTTQLSLKYDACSSGTRFRTSCFLHICRRTGMGLARSLLQTWHGNDCTKSVPWFVMHYPHPWHHSSSTIVKAGNIQHDAFHLLTIFVQNVMHTIILPTIQAWYTVFLINEFFCNKSRFCTFLEVCASIPTFCLNTIGPLGRPVPFVWVTLLKYYKISSDPAVIGIME